MGGQLWHEPVDLRRYASSLSQEDLTACHLYQRLRSAVSKSTAVAS